MILSSFIRFVLKDINLKNKGILAVLLLMIIPSLNTYNFVAEGVVKDISIQYTHDLLNPSDIMVSLELNGFYGDRWGIYQNVTNIIREVYGVEWVGWPWKVTYMPRNSTMNYYWYDFIWCNVSDPVFPKPKYVVEGRFFSSNNEKAVLLDRQAFLYFKKINKISKVGDEIKLVFKYVFPDNGTEIIADFEYTVVGVVSSPSMDALGASVIEKTGFAGNIILPIETFMSFLEELYVKFFKRGVYDLFTLVPIILVKVKKDFDIDTIAADIKEAVMERYPWIGITLTIMENHWRSYIAREFQKTLVFIIVSFVFIASILYWDVGTRRRLISQLRIMGWKRIHVVLFFILRYVILASLGSFIGAIVVTMFIVSLGVNPLYFFYIIVTYYPVVALVYIAITLLFSLPALIRAYSLNPERVIR